MSGRFCPLVKCRALLEERIDRLGRARSVCPSCERRKSGRCVDCSRPTVGKSWRCPEHKLTQRRATGRVFHARHIEERRAKDRRRWRALTPEQRERVRQLRRLRTKRNAAAHRARQNEWNAKHRIWYLAYHRRYNRRPGRAEAKRAQALKRYYELHPVRPDPKCLECGAAIEWTPGHGRPALRCPAHNRWKKCS